MSRFLKLVPSEEAKFLMTRKHNAFILLTIIAERARREDGNADGLNAGEAYIGDWKSYGFTEQQYRTAKNILIQRQHIEIVETCRTRKKSTTESTTESTTRATTQGTKVRIISTTVYDINLKSSNDRINGQTTEEQRRTRKNKKEEEIKEEQTQQYALRAVGCDVVVPFDFQSYSECDVSPPKYFHQAPIPRESPPKRSFLSPVGNLYKPPIEEKNSYGPDGTVQMTESQYEKLLEKMSATEREYWIEQISLEIGKKGEGNFNEKYKSHYHTILSWHQLRREKSNGQKLSCTVKNSIEENYNWSQGIEKKYDSVTHRLDVFYNRIEFTPKNAPCATVDTVLYDSRGFIENAENQLRKKNFKLRDRV